MTPQQLRAYVLLAMRDILPPLIGCFLSVYLPLSHQFEYWQLPLLAGLFGVPLVRGSGEATPDPRGDERPPVGPSSSSRSPSGSPSLPRSSSEPES